MANILEKVRDIYMEGFGNFIDPRNEDSFLSTFTFYITFVVLYISTVKYIGPVFMNKRQPFNLRNILIVYNSIQIIVNLYVFYESFLLIKGSPSYICIQSGKPELFNSCKRHYLYLKMFDCTETVFFVLRKSYRQISFLHVYHHCIILYAAWCGYTYYWGDNVTIIPLLNSFVHSLMFVYYLLTSVNAKWKENLRMKKTITKIQIIQLITMCLHYAISISLTDCDGSVTVLPGLMWIFNNIIMVYLFLNFYKKTYLNNKKKE
ncbi:elongation of very long chain fatty acids protein AAEL008004-like [Diorhabda sublineata]|uniref:elongation of very long chain fatty acids protein AAEL008004-like n=1 Tax=Diorhabda sublineata TaxID=1163346 RepID=UPI0024E04A91|nr:elongation of very long chain fatty acids protein AAEL008004-like [Diorhabda sublineata]